MIELNNTNAEEINEDIRHFGKRGHLNYGKAIHYKFEGYDRNKYHSMVRCMCGNIFSAHSHDISKNNEENGDELKIANFPLVCPECGTIIEEDKSVDLTAMGRCLYNSSHVRFIDDDNIYTISTVLLDADNTRNEPYPVISNEYSVRLKFRFNKEKRTALMYVSKYLCEDRYWDQMKLVARFINFTQPIEHAETYFKVDRSYINLVVPMEIRQEFKEFVGADWPLEALSGFEDLAWANRIPNYEVAKSHRECFKNLGRLSSFCDVLAAKEALRENSYANDWQKAHDEETIEIFKAYNRYKRFFKTGHMVKDFKKKTLKALMPVKSLLEIEDIHPELIDLFLVKDSLATIKNYSILEELFENVEKKKEVLNECDNISHGHDHIYTDDLSLVKNTFDLNQISIKEVFDNGKSYPRHILTMLETLKDTAEKIEVLEDYGFDVDTTRPFEEIYELVNNKYNRIVIPENVELLGDGYHYEDFDLGNDYIFEIVTNTSQIKEILETDFMEDINFEWEKYAYSKYNNNRRSKYILVLIEKNMEIVGCFDIVISQRSFWNNVDDDNNDICKMRYVNEFWSNDERVLEKIILFSTSLGLSMTSNFYNKVSLKDRVEFHETYEYNFKNNLLGNSMLPELTVSTSYFKHLMLGRNICFETPFFDDSNMALSIIENGGIMYRSSGDIFITRGISDYEELMNILIEHKIYMAKIDNEPSSFYTIEKDGHIIAVFNMKRCDENDEDKDIDILTHGHSLKRGKGLVVSHKAESQEALNTVSRLRDVYDDFLLKLSENDSFKIPMYEDITSDEYSIVDEDDLVPF